MRRIVRCLAAAWVLVMAPVAHASDLEDDLRALWESMWTQTGYPMFLSRWELPPGSTLNFRFSGFNVERQKQASLEAVAEVTSAAGFAFADVSQNADAEKSAHIQVEYLSPLTTNTELGDRMACAAFPKRNDKTGQIESVRILIKDGQAPTCMHHELMHAFGIPGHPSGKTILSYFPWRQDRLSELDKKFLKVWYTPKVRSGARVLEMLGPMSVEMAAFRSDSTWDTYRANERTRIQFIHGIVQEMESFATGKGEIPVIIKRSGLASSEAINAARSEIAFNLGIAYQTGALVPSDINQTIAWLELAASRRHVLAHLILYYLYGNEDAPTEDPIKAFQWLTLLSKQVDTPQIREALEKQRAHLNESQLQKAQELAGQFIYQIPS